MAVRKPPTERQRRLGAELRKMREHAGLSLTDAAALHGTDRTTVSNVESGRFGVSPDRVRVWSANYSCRDGAYIDALAQIARERRSPSTEWWDEYRHSLVATVLDLAELEHHASSLRMAQITHMPGLLQHEDYARAVFQEAVPTLTPDDFERKLAFRGRRRCVLDRPEAPECTFIIHETALCMRFGGAAVMRRQLDYLLEQSERLNVRVHVLPFAAGGFPAAASSTLYACGPVEQLDTVQTDTPVGSVFLHAQTHLANYRAVLERMEERSLDPDASRRFVREVAQRL
ncbi:Scr1 family TA system antitoxin-like transcriptional regulator [Streptomyces sp. DSM 42041]|uniref:Scr1 family TA system antitoxin-like transcriptional regulator n=1 Tax=Streptomyces hazeniae TaxID=3075538 RepID=A0ABU2NRU9_9ACTN|nr:Scr1 family TA system antitoxin-like transcriptional regulator [Streptomyces sp. DSM 42041]MDT0379711.1 Scr1 family TA system antitoxin-like transcriptional regulator [Streptomyces sp. DSM 42041]